MITAHYTHTWKSAVATSLLMFVATPLLIGPLALLVYGIPALALGDGLTAQVALALTAVFPIVVVVNARSLVKAGELRVTLDDIGYTRERVGSMSATVTWASSKGVFRKFGFFVVRIPGGAIAAVPETAFSTEQLAEIDAFLQARTAAPRIARD
jgi:hypothetical protein